MELISEAIVELYAKVLQLFSNVHEGGHVNLLYNLLFNLHSMHLYKPYKIHWFSLVYTHKGCCHIINYWLDIGVNK